MSADNVGKAAPYCQMTTAIVSIILDIIKSLVASSCLTSFKKKEFSLFCFLLSKVIASGWLYLPLIATRHLVCFCRHIEKDP